MSPPLVPEGTVGIIALVSGICVFFSQLVFRDIVFEQLQSDGYKSNPGNQVIYGIYDDRPILFPLCIAVLMWATVLEYPILATIMLLLGLTIGLVAIISVVRTVLYSLRL